MAKTIEFPRKQSSQKARAARIQQARKKLKNNFLFLMENF